MKKPFSTKTVALMAVAALIMALAPMLLLGNYLHPAADDYVFGAPARRALLNTHSVVAAVSAAIEMVMQMHYTWQGTYSAIFLMGMEPGVFDMYWLTPWVMLAALTASTIFLCRQLLKKVARADTYEWMLVAALLLLMGTQLVTSPVEGFYWFNGSVYYTFFYAAMLALAGVALKWYEAKKWRSVVYGAAGLVMGVFVAGGNFATALVTALLSLGGVVWLICKNKRGKAVAAAVWWVAYMGCFLFSATAPGNAVRAATITTNKPALEAIIAAIGSGLHGLVAGFSPLTIALLLVAAPVLWRLARRSQLSFARPWLFALITVALHCAFYAPTQYAMGNDGPERLQNLYWMNWCWVVMANLFYMFGAMMRKAERGSRLMCDVMNTTGHLREFVASRPQLANIAVTAVLMATVVQVPSAGRQALRFITSGKAAAYDNEMDLREKMLQGYGYSFVFKPLTAQMTSSAVVDIKPDAGHWINQAVCRYYCKKTVALPDTLNMARQRAYIRSKYASEVGPGALRYVESGRRNIKRYKDRRLQYAERAAKPSRFIAVQQ